jgi:hypothetical protein
MKALRRIVNLDSLREMMDIPSTFVHKKVEVLILPLEDEKIKDKKNFEPKKFYGRSHIKNIEHEIEKMRDEWT